MDEQAALRAPVLTNHALIQSLGEVAHLSSSGQPWTQSRWKGVSERQLVTSPETGFRVITLKLEPGTFLDYHAHPDEFEQVFVISGDFSDGSYRMVPGDYIFRRPGHQHIAFSENGAEVLVIFNKTESVK